MSATWASALFLSVGCLRSLASRRIRRRRQSSAALVRSEDEKALTDAQLLGKRIFEDTNLSEPRGQSCASCHAPKHAFQGNNGSPIAGVAAGSTPDKLGRARRRRSCTRPTVRRSASTRTSTTARRRWRPRADSSGTAGRPISPSSRRAPARSGRDEQSVDRSGRREGEGRRPMPIWSPRFSARTPSPIRKPR